MRASSPTVLLCTMHLMFELVHGRESCSLPCVIIYGVRSILIRTICDCRSWVYYTYAQSVLTVLKCGIFTQALIAVVIPTIHILAVTVFSQGTTLKAATVDALGFKIPSR